ncbi:MAG: ATP-binding protein [Persicimonas sp.]
MSSSPTIPQRLQPAIEKARELVSCYFSDTQFDPEAGRVKVGGERYLLVRAASMSVEFFEVVRRLYRDEGEEKAFAIAHGLLFDVAHSLGRADARAFHQRFDLDDPFEKLSTGPAYFARVGWASVDILEGQLEIGDTQTYMVYDHMHSFEADAWLEAKDDAELPVCTMSAGYSSGWVSESVDVNLASAEIMCRARGDDSCRFVMAHPDHIDERIQNHLRHKPKLAEHVSDFRLPGFFTRKRIEEALHEREEQYRGVFEASTDALLVVASDGKINGANRAAEELFRLDRGTLSRCDVSEILPLRTDFEVIVEVISAGDTYHGELELEHDDDEQTCHVEVRASGYRVDNSQHLLLTIRDVTRQKQMQEQLYRADRLASLGTMAAGVAHEINNPLSFIISNLEVTLWELDKPEKAEFDELREAIRRAKRGAERVERTVRDLTNFSHGGLDDSVEPVNVHRMLDLAAQMVEKTIEHKGGQLVKNYGDTPRVLANEARLNQVFVNLLLNAAQALSGDHGDENLVEITTCVDTENYVIVDIRDTGSGIPESIRKRVFDPFFTTKPVDQGTGIGLAICHEIVQAIGGQISLDTKSGEGTTFSVTLPTQAQFSQGNAPLGV